MIVVLGASGAVGSRLVRRLAAAGESVRTLIRRDFETPPGVERVRGDLLDAGTLGTLFDGATVIYYLVHAMGAQPLGGRDLVAEDRRQAEHALAAAAKAGRPRVVYVSGLGASAQAPSAHLRGRYAVEEALERSGLERVVFRAGVLLGPGSVGFEVLLRYVRSPLLPLPAWSDLPMQPFALSDLLDALVRGGREVGFASRTISVGTKDKLTYADLFRRAAKAMGLSPYTVDMPRELRRIGPLALSVGGEIPYREAEALVESMVTAPFLVEDDGKAMLELGIPYRTFEEALQLALRDAVKESLAVAQ